jgi:hypothetical protein
VSSKIIVSSLFILYFPTPLSATFEKRNEFTALDGTENSPNFLSIVFDMNYARDDVHLPTHLQLPMKCFLKMNYLDLDLKTKFFRYVPALNDANLAASIDPKNWKVRVLLSNLHRLMVFR